MAEDTYATRRAHARARLEAVGADGLICAPGRSLQYLTGFETAPSERPFLCCVPETGAAELVVPSLSEARVRSETTGVTVRSYDDGDDTRAVMQSMLTECDLRGGHLLVDDTMWTQTSHDLRAAAPEATWGLVSEALDACRITKSDREVAALAAAAEATDATMDDLRALGSDAVGMTEHALAAWIGERLGAHGGDELAFEPIVAAGENGAKPHHSHGEREIRPGDPVVCDFGTRIDDYPADQTRTVVFAGEPPAAYEAVHSTVREAQAAAVNAVEPGVRASAVDEAARSVIEAAGYGDAFVHRTGHGVGLAVHEPPYIVAGNDRRLEPGMVCSLEPGVYLEGRFGCRIEDLVVVTTEGARRLNTTGRGWKP